MNRIFRTRTFSRWMRKAGVSDAMLVKVVDEMAKGLIDADLGGNIVKKRVPLPGRGKRASSRTIVATNREDRWFFLYGFEKNERSNIDRDELKVFQEVATDLLALNEGDIETALAEGQITEVHRDD